VQRIDEAVVAFAPGLPDDDVAILAARITPGARVSDRSASAAPAASAGRD
jgi:hypothetical protein